MSQETGEKRMLHGTVYGNVLRDDDNVSKLRVECNWLSENFSSEFRKSHFSNYLFPLQPRKMDTKGIGRPYPHVPSLT